MLITLLLLLFNEEINNFIQKGCIKLINGDIKDIYGVTEESWKKNVSKKLLSSTVFITDNNNECFLSILEWFLKDRMKAAVNSALPSQE